MVTAPRPTRAGRLQSTQRQANRRTLGLIVLAAALLAIFSLAWFLT